MINITIVMLLCRCVYCNVVFLWLWRIYFVTLSQLVRGRFTLCCSINVSRISALQKTFYVPPYSILCATCAASLSPLYSCVCSSSADTLMPGFQYPCWRAMETGHPSTRAVNSASGNRALHALIVVWQQRQRYLVDERFVVYCCDRSFQVWTWLCVLTSSFWIVDGWQAHAARRPPPPSPR